MYTPIRVNVPSNQHEKLKEAITRKKPVSLRLHKEDLKADGNQTLLLTRSQLARLERAKLIGKGITIRMSRKQVTTNVEHEGGFLGMLAGLAAKALPSLLGGLATGLVSGAVEKAVGSGLFLHKNGRSYRVQTTKGDGLYLSPHRTPTGVHGDGLYLKHGSNIYDGRGLILGKNSPFKNIPILGWIL